MSKRTRLFGGALVLLLALQSAAGADTISFADAMGTLATECGADIQKFCSGENLGNGRIQACLAAHAGKVSPTCTATLTTVTASLATRIAAQSSFTKLCQHDVAQYCQGVVGEGNVLGCLNKATRVNERSCGQAIIDAGWR